ncbi:hypothetical protein [Pseudomonas fluorescens]
MPWTIESALADDSLDDVEMTQRGYSFRLKGISTTIYVLLYVNAQKGGFNFYISHLIKAPGQAAVYRPNGVRGEYEAYVLHSAISALTSHYSVAVKEGHVPCESWLVENDKGI